MSDPSSGSGRRQDLSASRSDSGALFETVEREIAYEGHFATVRVDTVRMPDGSESSREVVEQLPAAGVVPLLGDGSVILLRQYRQPFGRYLLEIPAGKLDVEGETPEEMAARELTEETGYAAGRLVPLTTFQNSAGWTDEVTHLYLGLDLELTGRPEDFAAEAEEAHMEIVRLPLHVAMDEVRAGVITDAKTVIGLLLTAGRDEVERRQTGHSG